MVEKTFLEIVTQDAEGYSNTLQFRIKDVTFGATTLPTKAHCDAVVAALYGPDGTTPSNQIVTSYRIVLEEDSVTTPAGNGTSATAIAARTRNEAASPITEWMFSIPGLSKSAVSFDPRNPNSILATDAIWATLRTALAAADIAIANPEPVSYVPTPISEIAQSISQFNGRRGPKRPT